MPAGVGNGKQRAGARSSKIIDRNMFLFEHAQHAQVRDSSRESSPERHADAGPRLGLRDGLRVGKFAHALDCVLQPAQDFLFLRVCSSAV